MNAKGMRRAYVEVLEEGLTENVNRFAAKTQPTELRLAVHTSLARGWLVMKPWGPSSPSWTTVDGERELRRLKHPRWFWFTENWFPALVAFATIGAAAAGVVVDIVK